MSATSVAVIGMAPAPDATSRLRFAAEIEPDPETDARVRVAKRRGTQDLGLMVLRIGLGAWLVVHGLQKAFGWWGGQGLNGYEHALAAAGFQHAGVLTYLATGAQIGAGVLLVLGLSIFAGGWIVYSLVRLAGPLRLSEEQEFDGADLSIHRISATAEREVNW